jgi:hypothetical protein
MFSRLTKGIENLVDPEDDTRSSLPKRQRLLSLPLASSTNVILTENVKKFLEEMLQSVKKKSSICLEN